MRLYPLLVSTALILISFIVHCNPLFLLEHTRGKFAYLPTSFQTGWQPGQAVSFLFQWNYLPKPPGTFKLSIDSFMKGKHAVLNPTITGPDSGGWWTCTCVLPNNLAPGNDWRFKFESLTLGVDIAESQPFVIVPTPTTPETPTPVMYNDPSCDPSN